MSIKIKVGNIGKLAIDGKKHLSMCVDLDEEKRYAKFYIIHEESERISRQTIDTKNPIYPVSFSATRNVPPALRKKLEDLLNEYKRIESKKKKIEEAKASLAKMESNHYESLRGIERLVFGFSIEDLQKIVDGIDFRGYHAYVYKDSESLYYTVSLNKEVVLEKYVHNTSFRVLFYEEYDGTYHFIRNTEQEPYDKNQKRMFNEAIRMGREKVKFLPLQKKYAPNEDLSVGDKISLWYSVEYNITIPKNLKDIKGIKKFLTQDIWKV